MDTILLAHFCQKRKRKREKREERKREMKGFYVVGLGLFLIVLLWPIVLYPSLKSFLLSPYDSSGFLFFIFFIFYFFYFLFFD